MEIAWEKHEQLFKFEMNRKFIVDNKLYKIIDRSRNSENIFYNIQIANANTLALNFTEFELEKIIIKRSFDIK